MSLEGPLKVELKAEDYERKLKDKLLSLMEFYDEVIGNPVLNCSADEVCANLIFYIGKIMALIY